MAIGKSTKFEEKEQQRRIERVIENKRERKGLWNKPWLMKHFLCSSWAERWMRGLKGYHLRHHPFGKYFNISQVMSNKWVMENPTCLDMRLIGLKIGRGLKIQMKSKRFKGFSRKTNPKNGKYLEKIQPYTCYLTFRIGTVLIYSNHKGL